MFILSPVSAYPVIPQEPWLDNGELKWREGAQLA